MNLGYITRDDPIGDLRAELHRPRVEPTWHFVYFTADKITTFKRPGMDALSVSEDMRPWFDENGMSTCSLLTNGKGRAYAVNMTPDQELLFKLRWT